MQCFIFMNEKQQTKNLRVGSSTASITAMGNANTLVAGDGVEVYGLDVIVAGENPALGLDVLVVEAASIHMRGISMPRNREVADRLFNVSNMIWEHIHNRTLGDWS